MSAPKRKPRKGTKADIFGSPAKAAQTRIDLAKQYGLPVDVRDEEIVKLNESYGDQEQEP